MRRPPGLHHRLQQLRGPLVVARSEDDAVPGGQVHERDVDPGVGDADLRYAETDGRVVVLTTTVAPEFRGRGIATDLIADALDDLRTRVGRVSVTCPVVGAFMTANPQFAHLLDPA